MEYVDTVLKNLEKFNLQDFQHSNSGLISHLKGTFNFLSSWNCEQYLAIAGLCHSVYGTESYRRDPIPLTERDTLQSLIGQKAEHLVYLFGCHEKESLWANLKCKNQEKTIFDRLQKTEISISEQDFKDLITITLANWLEQRPRAGEKHQRLREEEFLASRDHLNINAFKDFLNIYQIKLEERQ